MAPRLPDDSGFSIAELQFRLQHGSAGAAGTAAQTAALEAGAATGVSRTASRKGGSVKRSPQEGVEYKKEGAHVAMGTCGLFQLAGVMRFKPA